ncbi:MAG: AEC family transporter [Pseudomonadota bacterium]
MTDGIVSVFGIVLPVFALIGLGLGFRAKGWFGEEVERGLSRFVFTLAVPALIVRTLATSGLPDQLPFLYWTAYFTGAFIAWGIGGALSYRRDRDLPRAISVGFSSAFSNTVLLGIPLILTAFGEAGSVPLFLLVSIHLPVLMFIGTVLMEVSLRDRDASILASLKTVGHGLTHNAIFLGIILGGLLGAFQVPLPGLVDEVLRRLGEAAVPCALFAMGMTLVTHRPRSKEAWRREARQAAGMATVKLLIHPLIVFGLATWFALPPLWTAAAVLFAACPAGVNTYLFAVTYDKGVAEASTNIAVTSGIAVVSVTLWLAILQAGM